LEYFEDPSHFHVVMELCNGKNLMDHINDLLVNPSAFSRVEREASVIIRQCVKAVIGCHSKGFIHRDLKPENFLLTGHDMTIKLIDFGLATRCDDGKLTKGLAGTQAFIAPEMFHGSQEYDKAVDIWSLGVMLFMMLTHEKLFPDGKEDELLQDDTYVKQRVSECDDLAHRSQDAKNLVQRMLEWDPEKRITALEILEHPFIAARHGEGLCDLSGQYHLWKWTFDEQLPLKMERYAKSPMLRQIGLKCLVHLATAATLPDSLANELTTAKHHFRSLNPTGSGQVSEHTLRARLEQEGISIPTNFSEICRKCHDGRIKQDAVLAYDVFIACILIDAVWPDALLRETFNILDRGRDGVIEVEDFVILANHTEAHQQNFKKMIHEVDTEGLGYINYEKFMKIMEVAQPLFQKFATQSQE